MIYYTIVGPWNLHGWALGQRKFLFNTNGREGGGERERVTRCCHLIRFRPLEPDKSINPTRLNQDRVKLLTKKI
jgi:hypothetical protein